MTSDSCTTTSTLWRALYKIGQHQKEVDQLYLPKTKYYLQQPANATEDVLDNINNSILDQCQKVLDKNEFFYDNYSMLDIDQEIDGINPMLWNAIAKLTNSASEKRGKASASLKSNEKHKKRLRQYFILCVILFCADDRCSMPMHVLIADLIESQGGSELLIQALNRLGVCSSHDTLNRFVQKKLDSKGKDDPCKEFFDPNSFTVASVDNIDFLHSFARVFKGNNTSSWHGTTIQLVKPLPSIAPVQSQIIELTSANDSARSIQSLDQHSSRKRHERTSPVPSPSKLTQTPTAKSRHCRARTGTENRVEVDHQPKPPLIQVRHSEHVRSITRENWYIVLLKRI